MPISLSDKAIEKTYRELTSYHKKFLKKFGVSLPALRNGSGKFTKDALVLVYLAQGYPRTRVVSKKELSAYIWKRYPGTTDVQQARHLGAQKGWWIVAGGRDNIVLSVPKGSYQLYTLEKPYPAFTLGHRISSTGDWGKIKRQYGMRCATCGSVEGEPHLHWPATKTKLQKSHKNPRKPLRAGNIIPQCQKCNRADRNRWVYDNKGRVVAVASVDAVLASELQVQKEIYNRLKRKFS